MNGVVEGGGSGGTPGSELQSGGGASVGGTGNAWNNPGQVAASDDARSTQTGSGAAATNDYLEGNSYGFSIPADAEITGILVQIERRDALSGTSITDETVQLMTASGVGVGANKASGVAWSDTEAVFDYGGEGDLGGETWTPAQINDSGFGVRLRVDGTQSARVDHIQITVYYLDP